MRTFREHCSPRGDHLAWGDGSVEHHLDERELEYSHLSGIEHSETHFPQVEGDHFNAYDHDHHSAWHRSLDRKHRGTILDYKQDSGVFNSHLRMAEKTPDSLHLHSGYGDMSRYDKMDKITSNPTPRDHTVWRGATLRSGIHKLKPGSEFTDHGYTGTSFSRGTARSFAGDHDRSPSSPDDARPGPFQQADPRVPKHFDGAAIVARIHVPAGTRAHYLDVHPDTPHPENELTLHRGTRFRVTGHSLHRDSDLPLAPSTHVVHMEVVGQHPKKIRPPKWVEAGGTP